MKKFVKKSISVLLVVAMMITATPMEGLKDLNLSKLLKFDVLGQLIASATEVEEQYYEDGIYTYKIVDGCATIVCCDNSVNGFVSVPSKLGEYTVNAIDNGAFSNCTELTGISFPDTILSIGNEAFSGCLWLKTFALPSKIQTLGYKVLNNCAEVKSITIPKTLTKSYGLVNGVWATGAFEGSSIENVVFEYGMTETPEYVLKGCSSLKSVTLPATVTIIGGASFLDCTSLKGIDLPSGVTRIKESAFNGCSVLSDFVLPSGIQYLDRAVIANCPELTYLEIPASLIQAYGYDKGVWPSGAFIDSGLETVVVHSGTTKVLDYIFQGCRSLKNVTLPSDVNSIGISAFENCESLSSFTIPEKVTDIGNNAFSGCKSLSEIDIPETVKTIGSSAFKNCSSLSMMVLPKNVESIGGALISGCPRIKNITFPKTLTSATLAMKGSAVETAVFESGIKVVPKSILEGCATLEKVELLDGIEEIQDSAFKNCSALNDVDIPDSVKIIGATVFTNCASLSSMILPQNLEKIGGSFISGCPKIKSISFPKTLTSATLAMKGSAVETAVFESGATVIPTAMFEGCTTLVNVVLPDGIEEIQTSAFKGCSVLSQISIPESVKKFGTSIFKNCPNVTCYVKEDSEGIIAVINERVNLYPVESGIKDKEDRIINRTESAYLASSSYVSASGYFAVQVDYGLKDNVDVKDTKIIISLPGEVDIEVVKVDGETIMNHTIKDGKLIIPVNSTKGNIVFAMKPVDEFYLASYARLQYKQNNQQKEETIGILYLSESTFTLNVPAETSQKTISVSGIVSPKTEVVFEIDGVEVGSTVSSKVGKYFADIAIPDAKEGNFYSLTAKAVVRGEEKSIESQIRYSVSIPELTEFKFYYEYAHTGEKKCIDMLELNGTRPTTTIYIHSPMKFVIGIKNAEDIESVFVTSTKNGVKKSIKANYDTESGKYIAEGYFESENIWYVPGTINVEYIGKKHNTMVDPDNDIDFTDSNFTVLLPMLKDSEVSSTELENGVVVNLVVDELIKDEFGETIDLTIKEDKVTVSEEELDSIFKPSDDVYVHEVVSENGDKYLVKLDYSADVKVVMIIYDFAAKEMITAILENDYADVLAKVEAATFLYNYLGNTADHKELVQQIYQNSSAEDFEKNMKAAQELYFNKQAFLVISSMICLATMSLGPHFAVASVVLNVMVNVMGLLSEDLWALQESKILSGSEGFNINMLMDPSGFVYEAVESNRLKDVTATIYYKDPETGNAVIWNAQEYDQANPLITDSAGQYAWDVLEGQWQVKYEKEGYVTAYSEWLDVPPPQLNVNIGLISLKAPQVQLVKLADDKIVIVFDQYVKIDSVDSNSVVVMNNGVVLNGAIVPLNAEPYAKDPDLMLASEFTFVPETAGYGSYYVAINDVYNYAGTKMSSSYSISLGDDFQDVRLGDVNDDGNINSSDALLVLQCTTGIIELSNKQLLCADVSKDFKLTSKDALMILQYATNLIAKF